MRIKECTVPLWEYQPENYDKLTPEDVKYSEMTEGERRFVHGIVQYVQPKRILEVGVAEGGGSIVLLHAIEDLPDSTVTSIDLMEHFYRDPQKKVGFACTEKYKDHEKWTLIGGKDPSEVIESLGEEGKFDLVVIDTAHSHPIESLNFLCVFPFLTEDCVVILHDIGLYAIKTQFAQEQWHAKEVFPHGSFATKLLFDTLVGDKVTLPATQYKENIPFPNIGACQLQSQSKDFVGNVFSMLDFPWGLVPEVQNPILDLIQRQYSEELFQQCAFAFSYATTQGKMEKREKILSTNPDSYDVKKVVFYGCGNYLRDLLHQKNLIFSHKVDEVWDKNAKSIDLKIWQHYALDIIRPEDASCSKEEVLVVITLAQTHTKLIEEVKEELKMAGFSKVLHVNELKGE